MFEALIITLLILMTAFYVAAEFGAVSVRKTKVQQLAEEGDLSAQKLLPIISDVNNLDEYISVSQIGITLSSLILGAYGQATLGFALTPFIMNYFSLSEDNAQSTSAVVILIFLTSSQMILGELIPKSLALQFPVQVSLWTLKPMQWSIYILKWFLKLLNGSGNAILRFFKAEHAGHRHVYSTEEISMIIDESHNGGLLESEESRMLHQALKLDMRTARQLMIPRLNIQAINTDWSLKHIMNIVSSSPYTRMPVYQGTIDNVIGILHTKELVKLYVEKGRIDGIKDILLPFILIPESVKADKILVTFRETQTQQAIIIDEFGIIMGLITLEDVIIEIMGEIGDEFKEEVPECEYLEDGRMRLSGLMLSDDAMEITGIFWEGESDTVGGIISETLGRLPDSNEKLDIQGTEVFIEKVENRVIKSFILKPLEKEPVV